MSIKVRGSLKAELPGIDPAGIRQTIADKVAELIDRGFQTHSAPDGTPWAPPAHQYGDRPLEDTDALRKGFEVSATEDSIVVRNNVPYADYIQHGTTKMPARPMVPEDELPASWKAEIDAAVAAFLKGR
jgi:phage gpG-like protein